MNNNRCFSGAYYPRPINTTRRRINQLISNNGVTTVINPLVMPTWAYRIAGVQTVLDGDNVQTTEQASSGSQIVDLNGGALRLSGGTYEIEYNGRGMTGGQQLSLGLFVDGALVTQSMSGTDVNLNDVDVSGQIIITVPYPSQVLELKNISGQSVNLKMANLIINKIN